MRVLVCGGRDYENRHYVLSVLDQFAIDNSVYYNPEDNWLPSDIEIISGMARGVDTYAADWAIVNWCKLHEFRADWNKYGKRAGYIRNKQMLKEGKPDVVIAFPGGKGTAMMIKLAKEAGIEVREIKDM